MKVLCINGSSHPNGCTATALNAVREALENERIETELLFIGNQPVSDCIACGHCRQTGKCVFDDIVNQITEKAALCDGFIFGSPVYYAHPSGRILSVLDRAFYSGSRHFAYKPAAVVLSARRGGLSASFDALNKYLSINCMPVVASTYWNDVHGNSPDEVHQDLEGLNTMANLGRNMAWLLHCIEAGKQAGFEHPIPTKVFTNFVR